MLLKKNVYEHIGGGIFNKQEIKDAMMKVLFNNNKSFENVANVELTASGRIRHTAANTIRVWLRDNFPTMFTVLANFEEKYFPQEKGLKKFKSQYWRAFQ